MAPAVTSLWSRPHLPVPHCSLHPYSSYLPRRGATVHGPLFGRTECVLLTVVFPALGSWWNVDASRVRTQASKLRDRSWFGASAVDTGHMVCFEESWAGSGRPRAGRQAVVQPAH